MRAARLAVVAVALASAGAPATAAAAPEMTVVPGGVVDAGGRVAYLHAAGGGLDAVDLASGRLLWADRSPQKPLAVAGGRLLVEVIEPGAVRLRLRKLGAHGAVVVTTSEPLAVPEWATSGSLRGRSFDSTAEPAGPGQVRYRWWAEQYWALGMHPPEPRPDDPDPTRKSASGSLLVDLASGQVTAAPEETAPFASATVRAASSFVHSAWRVDGVWCALDSDAGQPALRTLGSDGAARPLVKLGATVAETMVLLSSDGRLLVLVEPGRAAARSTWLPAGTRGPSLPSARLGEGFAVVRRLLLVQREPRETAAGTTGVRELRAVTLDGEQVRWAHRLYRAPDLPPMR